MENQGSHSISDQPNTGNLIRTANGILIPKKKNKHKKRKNKCKRQNQQPPFRKSQNSKLFSRPDAIMTSWAESYTKAATWQFRHQIAYWKAKAKALEYENHVLHDIIRNKNMGDSVAATSEFSASDSNLHIESDSEEDIQREIGGEPDLEVSEAYIEFLATNAKYKEEARLERERLHADSDNEENRLKQMEATPQVENAESRVIELRKLYGEKWQKISALETSVQCNFTSGCDQFKPKYWPNIPFNFNYS